MSLGLASRAIIETLLRSRDLCVSERDVKRLLKDYGYSDKSVYVYIHRLARRGVVNRQRVGTTVQLCLEPKRLRDLGLILILLR